MIRTWPALLAVSFLAVPAVVEGGDPDPKSLDVPPDLDRAARASVRAFGDLSYAERERADRELKALGRMALPALREALATSSSAEVQFRCEMLLPHAAAKDSRVRVDCYLADTAGRYVHDVPGAKEFFAVAGRSEAARTLFREIVISPNQPLLRGFGGESADLAKAIADRRSILRPAPGDLEDSIRPTDPKAVDVAAILFAESFVPELEQPRSAVGSAQFLNHVNLRTALDDPKTKDVYLAILTKWIETREQPATLYQVMRLTTNLRLPTAVKCARKLLDMKAARGLYRGLAMTAIAKSGTAEDVALLESFMKDSSVLVTAILPGGNRRVPVQTRDAALALCLIIRKKDPVEYGMLARLEGATDLARLQYYHHYFDESDGDADEKRDAAVKRYEEWKADPKKN